MRKRIIAAGLATLGLAAVADNASAADMVAKTPRGVVSQTSASGFYLWADGSYQSINLPSVGNFGFQGLLAATTIPGGNERHDPRLDGYGVAGGFGYVFREGIFSPAWGSNVRIELGGNYARADGASVAESARLTNVNLTALNLLGVAAGVAGCGGVDTCWTQSSLTSDYTAWNVHLKGKSDFRFGAFAATPSIALIAGKGKTDHQLAQQLNLNGGLYPNMGNYRLNTNLDWTDVGGKIGLDTAYEMTKGLSLGLGGSVGLVHRSASMSANQSFIFGAPLFPNLSAIQDNRSTTSMLVNAEAGVTARLAPNVLVKGFGGLNYDSKVPGISAPESVVFAASGNPAHIKFESTTSYYAGGGVTVSFAP